MDAMSKEVIIRTLDDVDGSEDAETITFAYDGVSYEIDLATANRERLEKALEEFIAAARKTGGSRSRRQPAKKDVTSPKVIREWAKSNGFESVPERGRIPADVQEAFAAAHS